MVLAPDPHDWTPWRPSVAPGHAVMWRECRICRTCERGPVLLASISGTAK